MSIDDHGGRSVSIGGLYEQLFRQSRPLFRGYTQCLPRCCRYDVYKKKPLQSFNFAASFKFFSGFAFLGVLYSVLRAHCVLDGLKLGMMARIVMTGAIYQKVHLYTTHRNVSACVVTMYNIIIMQWYPSMRTLLKLYLYFYGLLKDTFKNCHVGVLCNP